MPGEDPQLRFRPEFPILEKAIYLISNSLGAMPRAAAQALAEYAQIWATRGVRAWAESWWDMPGTVGDEIAPLIGAPGGAVSMLPNVTAASAVILSSLEYRRPRKGIVLIEGEFPSIRYVYESLATRLGAEVVTVPSPGGVDYRPGVGIRMSPHFCTEPRELDSAFEAIDEILETGAWKRWEGRGGLVT